MENASKALVMAGGILIALLIIGALILMINQIGNYNKSQDDSKKNSQIVEFNLDFERYCDDKGIKGTDIISLINKINDYNHKSNNDKVNNYVNYDITMSIKVSGLDKFNEKYAYQGNTSEQLFTKSSYTFTKDNTTNNSVKNVLDTFKESAKAESIGINNLKIVSAVYNPKLNATENKKNIKNKFEELKITWDEINPSLDTIMKYRQYSEFKSSTFKVESEPIYENGQIRDLFFVFDK